MHNSRMRDPVIVSRGVKYRRVIESWRVPDDGNQPQLLYRIIHITSRRRCVSVK